MCKRLIYLAFFALVLALVGSASAGVLYSDTFNRPDSDTLGTNDNAMGGIISASWVELEGDETQIQISGNALAWEGAGYGYIDHKFTGAELLTSFTVEFDLMPSPSTNNWFSINFAPAPGATAVNAASTTLGLLFRPGASSGAVWDNATRIGPLGGPLVDNSLNPVPVRIQIDSPDGYNDGDTATVQLWVGGIIHENIDGAGGSSYDFAWDGHTDGLYILFQNNQTPNKSIDNLVISSPFSQTQAFDPSPADEATDVLRHDVVLSWQPGDFADQHDVYFGTVFDDVNDATPTVDPIGVYKGRQSQSTYAPARLDLGQTYYWRVDEVNAPPDNTIFKGDVWQFTVEPIGYPIENITPTASSVNRADEGPENTVNGSGLNDDDLHSSENTAMWLSSGIDPNATWIQYEFDRVHKLYQMWVWNYNTSVEPLIGFGIREATIEYSVNGTNWAVLGTTHEFAKGSGVAGYAPNTTIDLGGVAAKHIRITANSNWGGIMNQFGLSEVRFLYIPVWAREPSPVSGATDTDVDATLSWRAGTEAARHDIYLSTDEQAVIDGTAPVVTVTSPSYASSLDLAGTYYWRIDEVNDAETPTTWQGDIWSLSTQEYLLVEDFESYNDIPAGEEGSNLVYETWIDGFGTTTNGSTMGYTEAFQPSMEKTRIYDGKQSVPLFYNNTTASLSEVTANVANLEAEQNWAKYSIKGLTLRFSGDPTNAVQQMYVKLNGSKVPYDGDAENLKRTGWHMWYIDLASMGVSLNSATELAIGFERIGALGGQGMVLLDSIRLYSYDRQLITPVQPDPAGLVGHWTFDEGSGTIAQDRSGHGHDGTINGGPQWVAGRFGSALLFDGVDDSVVYLFNQEETWSAYTVALWVKAESFGQTSNSAVFASTIASDTGFQLDVDGTDPGSYQYHPGDGDQIIGPVMGEWVHLAATCDGNSTSFYYNGALAATISRVHPQFSKLAVGVNRITSRWFNGIIDDFRLYDRALSEVETAGLAGLTQPFDKPF